MKILKSSSNDENKWWTHQWLQNVNMDRSTVEEERSKDGHVTMFEMSFDDPAAQDENQKPLEMDKFLWNTKKISQGDISRHQNQKLQNGVSLDLVKARRERQNAQDRLRYHKKMASETAEQREDRHRKTKEKYQKRKLKLQTESQADAQYRDWAWMIVSKQQTEHHNRKRKHRDHDHHSDSGY